MLLMPSRPGGESDRAPDFEELVKTLDLEQIGFLATLLQHAAEHDYGVVEELFMHIANAWMDAPESKRKEVAGIVNEKFFTHKAFLRFMKEQEDAIKAGNEAQAKGLFGPDGRNLDDEPSN